MPEMTDALYTVSALRAFVTCPRLFYYHACLPRIRPRTFMLELGAQADSVESRRALREALEELNLPEGERHYDVPLVAPQLGLSGRLDVLIVRGSPPNALIPLDYKFAEQATLPLKLCLTAYAMLLEEARQLPVPYGYIYLIQARKLARVTFTERLREAVRAALPQMDYIARTQHVPDLPEDTRQCAFCAYRRFCNDIPLP